MTGMPIARQAANDHATINFHGSQRPFFLKILLAAGAVFPTVSNTMKKIRFLISLMPFACMLLLISPQSMHAAVTQLTFLNGMSGSNEVPPNASTGLATINTLEFDDAVGTFGTLFINISFSGLSSNATGSHLHGFTDSTGNAGVIQGLAVTLATSGTISGAWAPASSAEVDNLFNGLTYVNLHSSNFGGGELRGQVVPEPGVFSLLGLTVFALLRRRARV